MAEEQARGLAARLGTCPAEALLALRALNRDLAMQVKEAKRSIAASKAAFETAVLHLQAVQYEHGRYQAEIAACIGTEYAFSALVGPDTGDVQERLQAELDARKRAIEEKAQVALRRDALAAELAAKVRALEDIKRHLSGMLEGATKQLAGLVDFHGVAAGRSILKDLYQRAKDCAGMSEYDIRYHGAAASGSDEPSSREERLTGDEHVTISIQRDLTVLFSLTPERMLATRLFIATDAALVANTELWYLQLPLDSALLLTIPDPNGALLLRWVNALGGCLPDSSYTESNLPTVLETMSRAVALRKRVLERVRSMSAEVTAGSDPNRLAVSGAGTVSLAKGSLDVSEVTDDALRTALSELTQ